MRMLLLAYLLALPGCVAIHAANTPYPVDDEKITLGMEHFEVARILQGISRVAPFAQGSVVEYRYEDQEAWRGRVVLYFVTGPADLVFYPLEAAIQRAGQRWARALYNAQGRLVYFIARNAKGAIEIELGAGPKLEPRTRRYTFWRTILGSTALTRKGED